MNTKVAWIPAMWNEQIKWKMYVELIEWLLFDDQVDGLANCIVSD
jgi:hypothetical protein